MSMLYVHAISSSMQALRSATEDAWGREHGNTPQLHYFSEITRAAEQITESELSLKTADDLLLFLGTSQIYPQSLGIDSRAYGFPEPVALYHQGHAYGALVHFFGSNPDIWKFLNQEIHVTARTISREELHDEFDY